MREGLCEIDLSFVMGDAWNSRETKIYAVRQLILSATRYDIYVTRKL